MTSLLRPGIGIAAGSSQRAAAPGAGGHQAPAAGAHRGRTFPATYYTSTPNSTLPIVVLHKELNPIHQTCTRTFTCTWGGSTSTSTPAVHYFTASTCAVRYCPVPPYPSRHTKVDIIYFKFLCIWCSFLALKYDKILLRKWHICLPKSLSGYSSNCICLSFESISNQN